MKQIALALMFATSVLATDSTPAPDPQILLKQAKAAWGIETPNITIKWDNIGPCTPVGFHVSLREMERPEHLAADVHQETTINRIVFDDGTEGPAHASPTVWVIILNTSCQWEHLSVQQIVLHEVGHALGLKHTSDPSDIMYPAVRRKGQRITARDRQTLASNK